LTSRRLPDLTKLLSEGGPSIRVVNNGPDQLKRPKRPDKLNKPEKQEKPDKPDKPDKPKRRLNAFIHIIQPRP